MPFLDKRHGDRDLRGHRSSGSPSQSRESESAAASKTNERASSRRTSSLAPPKAACTWTQHLQHDFFESGTNGCRQLYTPYPRAARSLETRRLVTRPWQCAHRVRREILHIRTGGGETFCCLVGSENRSDQLRASVSPTPCARFSQSLLCLSALCAAAGVRSHP